MSVDPHLAPYLAVVGRVTDLARAAGPRLDQTVAACPAWTARQVVGHLVGVAEAWVAHDLDGYGSDAWAAAQVARFEGSDLEDVLAAWNEAANRFGELGPSPIGGTPAMWAFGDAIVHEADIRPVLDPGTRVPGDAMALGLKAAIARWRVELTNAGTPPLDIVATDMRTWRVGDDDAAAETVTTTGYELFRALYGRRSLVQVESWKWTRDPAVYLDVGLHYPFRWADNELDD